MTKAIAGTVGVLLAGLLSLIGLVGAFTQASSAHHAGDTSDIPPDLLPVYIAAATTCPGLPWEVLAAIGYLESRHAQGHANPTTGDVTPPISGPPLDGTHGNAAIPDPSSPDGWMHAQGPMQFLPTTWSSWARPAPQRPTTAAPNIQNAWDAIYTAAAYLCDNERHLDENNLDAAILHYNPSTEYLNAVRDKARTYGWGTNTPSNGRLAWPVDGPVVSPFGARTDPITDETSFHPGIDIAATQGTPIHAPAIGTVTHASFDGSCGNAITIDHGNGLETHYCHLSLLLTSTGATVALGDIIGLVGTTGYSTGPHLHFEVHQDGDLRNPLDYLPPPP